MKKRNDRLYIRAGRYLCRNCAAAEETLNGGTFTEADPETIDSDDTILHCDECGSGVECAICAGSGITTMYFDEDPFSAGWRQIERDSTRDGVEERIVWACPECLGQ
jgi:hypothetical protein